MSPPHPASLTLRHLLLEEKAKSRLPLEGKLREAVMRCKHVPQGQFIDPQKLTLFTCPPHPPDGTFPTQGGRLLVRVHRGFSPFRVEKLREAVMRVFTRRVGDDDPDVPLPQFIPKAIHSSAKADAFACLHLIRRLRRHLPLKGKAFGSRDPLM